MKIAFASDFHLGYNDDALEQARRVVADARKKADVIALAGDLFDTRVPKQETVHDAVRLFQEAKAAGDGKVKVFLEEGGAQKPVEGVPVLAIYGTHERRAKGLTNIIELLHSAGLVINVHARKAVVEKEDEKAAFQGMGGVPEEMAAKALSLMEFPPQQGACNVFLFHQTLRELIPQDEEAMAARDLPQGFDVYVDGHIHWRQEFKEGGRTILLPGSTVVTQMKANEAGPKGYYLYDTKTKAAEFVQVRTRPFVFRELEFSDAAPQAVEERVRKTVDEIVAAEKEVPLIKIKVTGTLQSGLPPSAVDTPAIERGYAGKAFLKIDRDLGSAQLAEKIDFIRKIREERKSVKEAAAEILKKRLEEKKLGPEELPPDSTEELLELLSEGEADLAVEKLTEGRK